MSCQVTGALEQAARANADDISDLNGDKRRHRPDNGNSRFCDGYDDGFDGHKNQQQQQGACLEDKTRDAAGEKVKDRRVEQNG